LEDQNTGTIVGGNIFSEEEEKKLVEFIRIREQGKPISKEELIRVVNEYLKKNNVDWEVD